MEAQLPKRLKKEPIIEAVFELRFTCSAPAASILPGILFSKLSGNKKIEQLPAAQLPAHVRAADPNLRFAPIIRIDWEKNYILFSDSSMAITCKIPYPGWTAFKSAILEATNYINECGIITSVQRYALKYIDIIPADSIEKQVSFVNVDLTIGTHKLKGEVFQVRFEFNDNDLQNIIQISANAEAKLISGVVKKGLLVDIDTIKNIKNENLATMLKLLPSQLDDIHNKNCEMFFECLKPETIEALEPVYE